MTVRRAAHRDWSWRGSHPDDAGRAAAARGALAEARRATPTIDHGRRALARLSESAGRQLAAHYREHGYEHAAITLAHNSLRDELGQERQEALATLAGLSEPQLEHVLGQPLPLAQNPVSERLADLQRADGFLSAPPAESAPRQSTFSAAAPTPASAELRDAAGRAAQPRPAGAAEPAAARSASAERGSAAVGRAPSPLVGGLPPPEPPPWPRQQRGGEG